VALGAWRLKLVAFFFFFFLFGQARERLDRKLYFFLYLRIKVLLTWLDA
jgi:hypothetical protein